ncbi:hypothetical protein BGZ76_005478, partial [Entomortierella beljakovae]
SANEAYLLLINSENIRQKRRKKLQDLFRVFQERGEDSFWANHSLKAVNRKLLVNSAIIAKKAGVLVQNAGFQEAGGGLRRYPSDLESDDVSFEVIDESDSSGSEIDTVSTWPGEILPKRSLPQKRLLACNKRLPKAQPKRGRTLSPGCNPRPPFENNSENCDQPPHHDTIDGTQTPPRGVQGHNEEIPLVEGDESTRFNYSTSDHALYNEGSEWFKSKIKTSIEATISEMKMSRFQEDWIHDLLYDR